MHCSSFCYQTTAHQIWISGLAFLSKDWTIVWSTCRVVAPLINIQRKTGCFHMRQRHVSSGWDIRTCWFWERALLRGSVTERLWWFLKGSLCYRQHMCCIQRSTTMENLLTARKRPPKRLLLALCVCMWELRGEENLSWLERRGGAPRWEKEWGSSGFFLTDPSSFSTSSVTLVIEVIGLVMIALFVLL